MMGKFTRIMILVAGAFLICYGAIKLNLGFEENNRNLHTKIIHISDGFGYEIYSGSKLLIKQDFIPAIKGRISFKTFDDAYLVANLVKQKLRDFNNPEISVEELNILNIYHLNMQ